MSDPIIHPSARIADDVHIGPYVVIGPNVVIESGVRLEAFISIGSPPEYRGLLHDAGPHGVHIGRNTVVREFTTLHAGTRRPTVVEDEVLVMNHVHIGHDCRVGSGTSVAPMSVVGGHVYVGPGANIGLATVIHQFRSVGAFTMVGMNSAVTRDLPPFVIATGSPARPQRVNEVGISRAGLATGAVERWWAAHSAGDPSAGAHLPVDEHELLRRWEEAVAEGSRG